MSLMFLLVLVVTVLVLTEGEAPQMVKPIGTNVVLGYSNGFSWLDGVTSFHVLHQGNSLTFTQLP